jgi:hypothetical protein
MSLPDKGQSMPSIAQNSLPVESEIDAFLARVFERFQSPKTFNPLHPVNLAGLYAKPGNRRRAFNQRDITRAFRAAKAAGLEVRVELTPDGRITLVPQPGVANGAGDDDDILARLT